MSFICMVIKKRYGIAKHFKNNEKKYISWKRAQNRYSGMQIMTSKKKRKRKQTVLYVHVILNSMIFPQILYDIVPYTRFHPSVNLILNYASS